MHTLMILPLLLSPIAWIAAAALGLGVYLRRGGDVAPVGVKEQVKQTTVDNPDALAGRIVSPGFGDNVDLSYFGHRSYETTVRFRNRGSAPLSFRPVFDFQADGNRFGFDTPSSTFAYDGDQLTLAPGETREVTYTVPLTALPATAGGGTNVEVTLKARDAKRSWWLFGPSNFFTF